MKVPDGRSSRSFTYDGGQYRALPDRPDVIEELRWGQVITLAFPKMKHGKLQSRFASLLRPKAEHLGIVEIEAAFRALPEYELRRAEVAFVSRTREFWIVDAKLQTITVVTREGSLEYKTGARIPLPLFAGENLAVDDIFA